MIVLLSEFHSDLVSTTCTHKVPLIVPHCWQSASARLRKNRIITLGEQQRIAKKMHIRYLLTKIYKNIFFPTLLNLIIVLS